MNERARAIRYRWAELPGAQPLERLVRRRIVGAKMMVSEVRLHSGCRVPTHAHENEQFACVISGRLRFGIGAEGSPVRYEITAAGGEVVHLPSMVPHSTEAELDSVVLDLFAPPSEKTGVDAGRS